MEVRIPDLTDHAKAWESVSQIEEPRQSVRVRIPNGGATPKRGIPYTKWRGHAKAWESVSQIEGNAKA